jgi:hypothetical protein
MRLGTNLRYDQLSIHVYMGRHPLVMQFFFDKFGWESPFWTTVKELREPIEDADSELSNALDDTLFTIDWRRREVR